MSSTLPTISLGRLLLCALLAIITLISLVICDRNDKVPHKHITIARIHEIDNCKDRPVRPYHLTHSEIFLPAKNTYAFSGEGVCEKATTSLEKIVLNVTKCTDRSKAICEHFQYVEWKSRLTTCAVLNLRESPWKSVTNAIHPRLRCANNVGKFTIRTMTVDYKGISQLFGDKKFYWIAQTEVFDQKLAPWLCLSGEIDFPTVRI